MIFRFALAIKLNLCHHLMVFIGKRKKPFNWIGFMATYLITLSASDLKKKRTAPLWKMINHLAALWQSERVKMKYPNEDKWRTRWNELKRRTFPSAHATRPKTTYILSFYFCPFSRECLSSLFMAHAPKPTIFDGKTFGNVCNGPLFQKLSSENKHKHTGKMSWTCWAPFITHVHTSNV